MPTNTSQALTVSQMNWTYRDFVSVMIYEVLLIVRVISEAFPKNSIKILHHNELLLTIRLA